MAKIVCENIVKKFGEVTAVDNFNLTINDNEFIVIVGPSGCGKSTILRMVAGLEEQTSGNIYIGDNLVNNKPPRERNIAMVFQNYALYPHMNVYENMSFSLKLSNASKDETDRRVKEAAQILGIGALLNRKPKELSGGQRQRVALGRAIVREPDVFLMDEPLSNLDAKLRVQMRAEIAKLHERLTVTTLYVTHDQTEAMTMADRIVVIKDGIIQQIADPQTLYDRPANKFVAGFIGTPPMNFLNCRLIKEKKGYSLEDVGFDIPVPLAWVENIDRDIGQEVILGIRPEEVGMGGDLISPPIRAVVEVVEPLGAETLLNLKISGQSLVARVEPEYHPSIGEEITLCFAMKKAHLFEKESGITII